MPPKRYKLFHPFFQVVDDNPRNGTSRKLFKVNHLEQMRPAKTKQNGTQQYLPKIIICGASKNLLRLANVVPCMTSSYILHQTELEVNNISVKIYL